MRSVEEIWGTYLFNATKFFNRLVISTNEKNKAFLGIFPQFPQILDFSRQAAEEEVKKRGYEVKN